MFTVTRFFQPQNGQVQYYYQMAQTQPYYPTQAWWVTLVFFFCFKFLLTKLTFSFLSGQMVKTRRTEREREKINFIGELYKTHIFNTNIILWAALYHTLYYLKNCSHLQGCALCEFRKSHFCYNFYEIENSYGTYRVAL